MYHGVAAHAGDPSSEFVPAMGASLFACQVRHVARHYRVVRAGELRSAVAARRRGGRFRLP